MINQLPYSDLTLILEDLYQKHDFHFSDLIHENESTEYNASTFTLNGMKIKYRSSKITPTKTGQFVTLWKRDLDGVTKPHDHLDTIDLVIISARKDNDLGLFIFPKDVLLKQSIFSTLAKEGKRGFRVYPSWDKTQNKQAQKTQNWQLNYFLDVSNFKNIDINLLTRLHSCI